MKRAIVVASFYVVLLRLKSHTLHLINRQHDNFFKYKIFTKSGA